MLAIPITRAMADPNLFGKWFAGDTWATWSSVLKAAYGLPMTIGEVRRFQKVAGGRDPPKHRVKELWVIAGRRSGKDSVASLIAAYTAVFNDYQSRLRGGEKASVICLAVDRQQARIVHRYTRAYFEQPLLAPLVVNDNEETLELDNGCEVIISTNSFRSIRGKTFAAAIFDEVSYWRDDEVRFANPAQQVYESVVPGFATLYDTAMLVGITSPFMRSGLAYEKWERHWARNDDDILVVGGPTTAFNPTVPQPIIDAALARDEAAARSEWLGEWRDLESAFLPTEVILAAVDDGVITRMPEPHCHYQGFVDAAGGAGSDSFTCAITHRQDGTAVLDAVLERTPPFSPSEAVGAIAALCKAYRIKRISGDRYAGEWPAEAFSRHGITYEPATHTRSEIYVDTIPLFTSGRVRILDNKKLVDQFAGLRRRVQPGGKETIDHLAQAHDDLSNAAAGALVACLTKKGPMIIAPEVIAKSAMIGRRGYGLALGPYGGPYGRAPVMPYGYDSDGYRWNNR
jgi:hypothetical protein